MIQNNYLITLVKIVPISEIHLSEGVKRMEHAIDLYSPFKLYNILSSVEMFYV